MLFLPSSAGIIKPPSGGGGYDVSPVTKFFTTAVEVNNPAPSTFGWTNPTYADGVTSPGNPASISMTTDDTTDWLYLTNAGFNIDPSKTITDILIEILCYYVDNGGKGNTGNFATSRLLKANTPAGAGIFPSGVPANSAAYVGANGSPAAWGTTVTPTDMNDSGFGYALALTSSYIGAIDEFVYKVRATATFS